MSNRNHFIPIGEVHYLRRDDPVPTVMAELRLRSSYCGLTGLTDDRVGDTFDGVISRWRGVENPKHVTCRNCRKHGGLIVV